MEQDIQDYDKLLLRFKYNVFFDINPKVRDPRRTQKKENVDLKPHVSVF